jgi:hypothetical protein
MPEEPRDFAEYKTDHDLLIELKTVVHLMSDKLDKMAGNFVTQAEFWPVKALVYGFTTLMLTSVVGALLFLVLRH